MRIGPLLLLLPLAAFADTQTEKIDSLVNTELSRSHTPGISVAIVEHGKLMYSKGYGMANVEWSAPAGPDTVYELLSIAKQFTSTAILMLAAEGKLALDDPVSKYLPGLPTEWNAVTVRHLLTHTSGIRDYTEVKGWRDSIRLDRTPQDLVKTTFGPLLFAPGAAWQYSNTNYYVLGLLIEKLSGVSYARFIADRIFVPLAMQSTLVNDPDAVIPHRAAGYHWDGTHLLNAPYISPTQKWAAGAVVSTADDLAKWAIALDTASLLPRETLAQMVTPAKLSSGQEAHYGIGNELDRDHGHLVAGHQGGGSAFNATFLRFPNDELTVIVLGNLTQTPSRPLAMRIAAIYLPDLSDATNRGIADPDPALTATLRGVLASAAQGKTEPELFAPEVREKLMPFLQRMGPQFLGPLGELKSFALLEISEANGHVVRRYRATFAKGQSIVWTFELTKDGKVIGLEPKQE